MDSMHIQAEDLEERKRERWRLERAEGKRQDDKKLEGEIRCHIS